MEKRERTRKMPMSTGQKRLLAVVVVVVIVVAGVGIYLAITPSGPAWVTPGAPSNMTSSQMIKVGVLDDMTDVTGIGSYRGSWLAAYEVNSAGGVVVNGTHYYFSLISENTYEAAAELDTSKGVAAAEKIITVDGAQFITGGFRTESVLSYRETVMDHKLVFIGTGTATDSFCLSVYDPVGHTSEYSRYKYWFRDQPLNSTTLGTAEITELGFMKFYLADLLNATNPGSIMYPNNLTYIHKWAIIREDLDWTIPMDAALKAYMGYIPIADANHTQVDWDATPTDDIALPLTATASDFASALTTIQGHGAQLIIPIFSAGGGVLLDEQYNATKPKAFLMGINVPSQLGTFWNSTGGACKYEIVLQTITNNNAKSPMTIPFYNHYVGNFSAGPIYTSVGGYDAIHLLQYAINKTQSFNDDKIVTALETVNALNPILGPGGNVAFTTSHDLFYGWPLGVPVFAQWIGYNDKPVIPSPGPLYGLYPNSIVMANVVPPPWGINGP
jgi:ABC-type branched-subunit amino acid transport system substrate-binding protein